MKSGLRPTQILTVIVGTFMVVAACAPMPTAPPGGQTSDTSVFLPGVEQPRVAVSPLQPIAVSTESAPPIASAVPLPSETPLTKVVGPVWQWVSSTFGDGAVLTPGDPSRYTFQLLPDGNALVQADCNFGTATYQETAESFTFGPIGSTKMACPPDSLDSEFLGQLRNLDRYVFNADGLLIYLLDDAGAIQLQAVAAAPGAENTPSAPATSTAIAATPSPATSPAVVETATIPVPPTPQPVPTLPLTSTLPVGLAGVAWTLTSFGPVSAPETVPVGATITLEITPSGQVGGKAACNRYFGGVTADGSRLSFGMLAQTEMACEQALMSLERTYLDALMAATIFTLEGGRLTINYEDGQSALAFTSSAPVPQTVDLSGTSWNLASLSVNGQAMSPVEGTTVTLELAANGNRISGSTGCNQYRAALTTDAAGVTITGPALLTRKACAASIMVQEVAFLDALLRTRASAINEDELTLLATDDETLLVFVRR